VSVQSANEESDFLDRPRAVRGFDYGLLAGLAFAFVYGFMAEPIGLTWGLVAIAFVGGMVVGASVKRGAWSKRPHNPSIRIQLLAALIALGAWIVGLFLAYFFSQAFFPEATTPLLDRVSIAGFSDYFVGLFEQIRLIHAASLAAVAFMAWRWAR
jgi:hypothetical protein